MDTKPKISVALCTYNAQKFLQQQLDSIVQQTLQPNEIVCCDDGSTDNTKQILEQYQQQYPTIFKLHFNEKNVGYIKNFEQALWLCKNECIAISDHDDIWLPQKLEKLYNNCSNSMLTYSDSQYIDENGNKIDYRLSDKSKMYNGNNNIGFVLWNVVWGHTVLLKKELLQHALPIPHKAPYDIWLAYKACTLGNINYVNEVLTLYRQHSATVTNSIYGYEPTKKSRTLQKRYAEFKEKLYWIGLMRDNETRPYYQQFYTTLYQLFNKKDKGVFVWSLFIFLVKNRASLFLFRNKNFTSQIIECRKLARGEKNV